MIEKILVKIKPVLNQRGYSSPNMKPVYKWEVEGQAYNSKGEPIKFTREDGAEGNAGQISTSVGWSVHDMREHFKEEYDKLYPDGWEIDYEVDGDNLSKYMGPKEV